ncbi:MAG: zinc ribbon domain-containing protein [Chloroflexi bacterium]|nr:zinc ribbon domain-containing protein [Chloroflexota bacterium]
MTTGSILIGAAMLLLVVLYLARPLLQASQREQKRLSYRQSLLAEKDAILDQIRDLDFDRDTGKMPDEIHQRQRAQLMESAADVLRQLEQLDGAAPGDITGDIKSRGDDTDAAIEAAVARMRQGKSKSRPAPAAAKGGGFCPNCGHAFDTGDKFCVSCGRKL